MVLSLNALAPCFVKGPAADGGWFLTDYLDRS